MDLRELARLLPVARPKRAIRAPWGREAALHTEIGALRKAGEVVIQSLSGHENDQDEFECDRVLELENGNWIIKKLGYAKFEADFETKFILNEGHVSTVGGDAFGAPNNIRISFAAL